jgi:NAD(P)-dependent dehydrogenase (short-subunit alcohol dehydrogenase family)
MGTGGVHAKFALVMGAGSGVDRAAALLLAQDGATVIVTDTDAHTAEQVTGAFREAAGGAEAMRLDLGDEST